MRERKILKFPLSGLISCQMPLTFEERFLRLCLGLRVAQ